MSVYEPGTVAVATVRGVEGVRVMRVGNGVPSQWITPDCKHRVDDDVTDVRPLIVLDPTDIGRVERLRRCLDDELPIFVGHSAVGRALLALDAPPKPRCSAHGDVECAWCSRIAASNLTGDGGCNNCETYGQDGMHWDTCPSRLRGVLFANREQAMEGP